MWRADLEVQLTVNNCIDCIQSVTFIGIDGKMYVVKLHSAPYSNEKVSDSVETCDGIAMQALAVNCSGGKPLYECQP